MQKSLRAQSDLKMVSAAIYTDIYRLDEEVAETCARLAGNLCQYLTTVTSGANSLVWVTVCYFTAS
jgi:hypothetical protein